MKPIADYQFVELGAEIHDTAPRPDIKVLIDFHALDIGLDAPHIPDDEADRILGAIWQFMIALTDLGFGRQPIQQIDERTNLRADLHDVADRIYREVITNRRPKGGNKMMRRPNILDGR